MRQYLGCLGQILTYGDDMKLFIYGLLLFIAGIASAADLGCYNSSQFGNGWRVNGDPSPFSLQVHDEQIVIIPLNGDVESSLDKITTGTKGETKFCLQGIRDIEQPHYFQVWSVSTSK